MFVTAVIFIICGYLVKYKKMYWLIAGYNTMDKKEQDKIDIHSLATVFKNALFGMAFLLILGWAIKKWFLPNQKLIEWYFMFGTILIGVPYLIFAGNTDKHKK